MNDGLSAVPSPANDPTAMTGDQYTHWRQTGELEPTPKADPAPAKTSETSSGADPEKPAEAAPDSQPEKVQEPEKQEQPKAEGRKHPTAEQRIKQLLARQREMEAELKTLRESGNRAPAPSEPKAQPVENQLPPTFDEWKKATSKPKWMENYSKQHPELSYEDVDEAWDEHKFQMREQYRQIDAARQQFNEQLNDARKRYPNLDDATKPAVEKMWNDPQVSNEVKSLLLSSPILPDLLYVIGSDADKLAELANLAKTNPARAIRELVVTEKLVLETLDAQKASSDSPRNDKGQFQSAKAPEKEITKAPPPPQEAGARTTPPADAVSDAVEKQDYAAYKAEQNRREIARRKGQL